MNVHRSLPVKEVKESLADGENNSLLIESIVVAECQCRLGNLCKWRI